MTDTPTIKTFTSRPHRLAGVLFDLDGTLLDTHDLILASFRHATAQVLGAPLPDEQLMARVGVPLAQQMADFSDDPAVQQELLDVYRTYNHRVHDEMVRPDEQLMARVGVPLAQQMADFSDDPAVQQELLDVYRTYNHRVHDEMVREFEGVSSLVTELRERGVRLGVVTSKRRWLAQRGLALFGLDEAFEFVIGSDDCERHKPDPEPILMGCERLGLEPGACAYVGDSPFDLQAARAAGVTAVAALWGMFSEEALAAEQPDALCRQPMDVLGVV